MHLQFGSPIIRSADCPHSLRLLVQFYRCFAYSFSGVVFEGDKISDKSESKKKKNKNSIIDQKKGISVQSALWLTLNALFVLSCLFVLGPLIFNDSPERYAERNQTTSSVEFDFKELFDIESYKREFVDIKPILRLIMQSIVYIFLIEALINYTVHLLTGGKLIRLLIEVSKTTTTNSNQRSFILNDRTIVVRLLAVNCAVILATVALGLALFNAKRVTVLVQIVFGVSDQNVDSQSRNELIKMVFLAVYHFCDYVMHSKWPILFVYTMMLFKEQIKRIRMELSKENLDESHLYRLKKKLIGLHCHFKAVTSVFAIPLTIILAISIAAIVGSSCFLMVNRANNHQHYYVSSLFSFGLFALIRLLVICWMGSVVSTEYRELVRTIHEQVTEWTLDGWMCFGEIQRMRAHFRVNFFETYAVRQSTILSTLGFALNYIVVLLQTDNYGNEARQGGAINK